MATQYRYAMCVKNRGYPVSLEVRKVYRVLPDRAGARLKMVRVIDETGEDYLFPAEYFQIIALPKSVVRIFSRKSA